MKSDDKNEKKLIRFPAPETESDEDGQRLDARAIIQAEEARQAQRAREVQRTRKAQLRKIIEADRPTEAAIRKVIGDNPAMNKSAFAVQ